jgi:hypothetical protein
MIAPDVATIKIIERIATAAAPIIVIIIAPLDFVPRLPFLLLLPPVNLILIIYLSLTRRLSVKAT